MSGPIFRVRILNQGARHNGDLLFGDLRAQPAQAWRSLRRVLDDSP